MKNILKTITVLTVFAFMFSICGCSKEIKLLTDIPKYSTMKLETDKIEVFFDNHSGNTFDFVIDNPSVINEVMEIVLSSKLKKSKKIADGDNTKIIIIQSEKKYELNVRVNKNESEYYFFETDTLSNKITELAQQLGAFQNHA